MRRPVQERRYGAAPCRRCVGDGRPAKRQHPALHGVDRRRQPVVGVAENDAANGQGRQRAHAAEQRRGDVRIFLGEPRNHADALAQGLEEGFVGWQGRVADRDAEVARLLRELGLFGGRGLHPILVLFQNRIIDVRVGDFKGLLEQTKVFQQRRDGGDALLPEQLHCDFVLAFYGNPLDLLQKRHDRALGVGLHLLLHGLRIKP